jgi:glycogen debranching enzyme
MASDFFSGWGIRTVAEGASRYNPMSYHNGSVWPHDNALIALGFARYGLSEPVCRVFDAVFDAARWMEFRRLPELYCGFRRRTGRGPTLYPVACSPQAWASGAPFALIQAALGMRLIPELGEIQFRNPTLPDTVDWIKLRNVTIGGASADILVRRVEGSLSVDLVRVSGNARVTIEMMQTNPKTAI